MKAVKKMTFLIILTLAFLNCSNESNHTLQSESVNEHASIYLELLNMEYALLNQNYDQLISHSRNLDDLLKENYNLFCPGESAQIDGARMINHILVQHIKSKLPHDFLDDLRILKASIINLEEDEDFDPYYAFLWRFEEEMHIATQIAIDPMLDLYEWNEFNNFVICMKDSWQLVKLHNPSPAIFNNDPSKYKMQSVYKIYLESAYNDFIQTVASADYNKYPLCDSAEKLNKSYIQYIKTFIHNSINEESFLALL